MKLVIPVLLLLSVGFTARGAVETKDLDFDGVLDHLDLCQQNEFGDPVDASGCPLKSHSTVEIKFDSDSDQIKKDDKKELNELAEYLDDNPKATVKIQGYADSVGTEEHNSRLADKRVDAVINYLSEKGVERERVETKIFGEAKPIASNKEATGRAANRRVRAILVL